MSNKLQKLSSCQHVFMFMTCHQWNKTFNWTWVRFDFWWLFNINVPYILMKKNKTAFMNHQKTMLQRLSLDYTGPCIHINGLVQDCSISSALAMEILQSCTKPVYYFNIYKTCFENKCAHAQNRCMVCTLSCFVPVCLWLILSILFRKTSLVRVKKLWRVWGDRSYEST